jgi:hypothetical protein
MGGLTKRKAGGLGMGEGKIQGTFGRGIFSFLFVGILSTMCFCPVSGEVVGTGDPNSFEPAALDSVDEYYPATCDIGIGYSVLKGLVGHDGRIDIADIAVLSIEWLRSCSAPSWCSQADINHDGRVEINDLILLTDCWLEKDMIPPAPNPAQWGERREGRPDAIVMVDGKPKAVPGTLDHHDGQARNG